MIQAALAFVEKRKWCGYCMSHHALNRCLRIPAELQDLVATAPEFLLSKRGCLLELALDHDETNQWTRLCSGIPKESKFLSSFKTHEGQQWATFSLVGDQASPTSPSSGTWYFWVRGVLFCCFGTFNVWERHRAVQSCADLLTLNSGAINAVRQVYFSTYPFLRY